MAVIKCSVCGGELEVNTDLSIGKCKYCESTILIPKNFERKGNLYNRAVFLRQNSEFDKAAEAYEGILKEDNTDVDAHWGLVLSKYGIEYVDDPRTGKKVPTCHRTQPVSILADPDYLAAVENADFEASRMIRQEANIINEIQRKILSIAKNEPPYDVFICYKESDELDRRTEDSVIAQDLYYELTKKGYKVFFARKTLEKKLGSEYEPIIYAALNSAQVMVVLGTKPENFTSVWVKNEWNRFLKMGINGKKTIIPAYKGMSPYELPVELASLQALDISRIGFIQELCDSISRLVDNPSVKAERNVTTQVVSEAIPSVDRLIKNGETFLSLTNYPSAEASFQKATEFYPEDYRGWVGLIYCQTKCFSYVPVKYDTDLSVLRKLISNVKQLAPEDEYAKLREKVNQYCMLVAQLRVPTERNRISSKLQGQEQKRDALQRQIQEAENACNSLSGKIKETKDKLAQARNSLGKCEEDKKTGQGNIAVGRILLIVGIILFFPLIRLTPHTTWFLPFIAIGIGFWGYLKKDSGHAEVTKAENGIKQLNNQIAAIEKQNNEIRSLYEESMKRLSQIKISCQDEIGEIENSINKLKNDMDMSDKELESVILPTVIAEIDKTY